MCEDQCLKFTKDASIEYKDGKWIGVGEDGITEYDLTAELEAGVEEFQKVLFRTLVKNKLISFRFDFLENGDIQFILGSNKALDLGEEVGPYGVSHTLSKEAMEEYKLERIRNLH
jgi:hypothetical protein